MYWTDQGTESGIPAKVACADMDGSNSVVLFTNNLDHVEFITIDIKENKLYWAVTGTGMVSCLVSFHNLKHQFTWTACKKINLHTFYCSLKTHNRLSEEIQMV